MILFWLVLVYLIGIKHLASRNCIFSSFSMSVCILSEARVDPRLLSLVKNHLSISQIPFKIALYEDGEDFIHKTLQQSSAVFCAPGRWLSESIISSNSHIVLYQLWSSGYDKFNHTACCKHKIKFNNNRGNNSVSVSEHAILLMLAANRKLVEMDDRVRTGKWAVARALKCLHFRGKQ